MLTTANNKYFSESFYYASGLSMAQSYGEGVQPYKYNGKEFVEMHGLNEYDSHARWYYPAIMRTTTMDPLAEKYSNISPYAWCGNNMVNRFDPDGRKWKDNKAEAIAQRIEGKARTNIGKQLSLLSKLQAKRAKYGSEKLQTKIDRKIADAQLQIMRLKNLEKNIELLTESENVYSFRTVYTSTAYLEKKEDGSIIINNFGGDGSKAHEMTHAAQYEKGKVIYDEEKGFISNAPEGLVGLEIEAYQTEYAIDGSVSAKSEEGDPESILDINEDWINGIPNPNGSGQMYNPSEQSTNPLSGVFMPWRYEPQILGL